MTTNQRMSGNKVTTFELKEWETQSYKYTGQKKSRKVLQLKKGSVEVFMKELKDEIDVYSAHFYNALWAVPSPYNA